MEEVIENLDETVMDNSLTPNLIVCGLNTGGEVFFQPPDVTEPIKVLEQNDGMTTKTTEMLNEDDKVRVAAADVNFSASELDEPVSL